MLLADLVDEDPDPNIAATLDVIVAANADILLILDIDYDAEGHALAALADALAAREMSYPNLFSRRPNTGRPTGVDVDGNGRLGEPRDTQGYGRFNGQGGMALLSRLPIETDQIRDFTDFLWANLPESAAPRVLSPEAAQVLRLATVAAWDIPLRRTTGETFHILAFHASPPVFDGPEDRNGWRNADELRFWQLYLDGWSPNGPAFTAENFALMGTLNVDPDRGEGHREVVQTLLNHPALQDPAPRAPDGRLVTTDWDEPTPGNLRVDYILPAATLNVTDSGILWPDSETATPPRSVVAAASDHRLIWVDLEF